MGAVLVSLGFAVLLLVALAARFFLPILMRPRCSRCRHRAIARYTWPGQSVAYVCTDHVLELFAELEDKRLTPGVVIMQWLDKPKDQQPTAEHPTREPLPESEPWDMRAQAAESRASRLARGGP